MNQTVLSHIETVTGEKNLANKTWNEIVDNIILPRMAGPKDTRWCINDRILTLLAKYSDEIVAEDIELAGILHEIALQRLLRGAVCNGDDTWPAPLPEKYWEYSARYEEGHSMSPACYDFLMSSAMDNVFFMEMTRGHAKAVVFGLMSYIKPNGKQEAIYCTIQGAEEYANQKRQVLFFRAASLAEKYCSFDEIYEKYAKPDQWRKHPLWFSDNNQKLDWNKFFADIEVGKGMSLFKRWQEERYIRKRLINGFFPDAAM